MLDLLMPPLCPVTGEAVAAPALLSAAGWSKLHFIEAPYCRRCGVPFSADYGDGVECPSCIAAPPVFDRARAAIVYDDVSHKLVVGFKHSDRTELTAMFGAWLARAGAAMLQAGAVVAPMPLHRRRLAARRFNQSALLAEVAARAANAPYAPRLLRPMRATPPQKELSAEGRRRNVAGAFAVSPKERARAAGARIILVDDVLTTGATLDAAARALKAAGAASVEALVLARVVKGGVGAI